MSNRKNLLIAVYLWLAAAAGLLAVCTWLDWVHPYVILTTVFLLGIGYTPGMQVILTRNFLLGLFIEAVPALMPVVALQLSIFKPRSMSNRSQVSVTQ